MFAQVRHIPVIKINENIDFGKNHFGNASLCGTKSLFIHFETTSLKKIQ